MSPIQVLDPATAARIAAGEVITRPAAVVKELIENALDAGAQSIAIRLEDGGRRRILVVDDGCGMPAAEAPLSILRHATSKIRREEDLLTVATLGFRGEALASLAAVARLTIVTRAQAAAVGLKLVVRGGEVTETTPVAAPAGTQVTVEELFYNTPARRKFLRGKDVEQAAVVEVVRQLALGYPQVHFELATPERTLVQAPATSHLRERVASLFGPEVARRLLPCDLDGGPLGVRGLVSDPDFSVASTRFQTFLVNRRVVQDRLLAAVLREVYQGRLPRGRHPVAVVSLSLPPEEVDVNVHPAKTEVRFRESGRLYGFLVAALRQALGALAPAPPSYQAVWQPASPPVAAEAGAALPAASRMPLPLSFLAQSGPEDAGGGLPPFGCRFSDLVLLGQLNHTYILAQSPAGLVIIDQHAAHERLLYDRLRVREDGAPRQALLFPRLVEVHPTQAGWLRDNLELLAQTGLILEPFGGAAFLVTAMPACLMHCEPEALVLETLEALSPLKSGTEPETVGERARLTMACRGAIKAGQALGREDMAALLAQLEAGGSPSHCPHGRPLWRLISLAELHENFGRPKG